MKYSINWLKNKLEMGEAVEYLLFWGHTPKKEGVIDNACFSQWFPSPFIADGTSYATAEHWMMAGKAKLFGDTVILQQIVETSKPALAKELGRKVSNFDGEVWAAAAYPLVVEGNKYKFSQHESLKNYLLQTGNKIIVEASPFDKIWGIGMDRNNVQAQNPFEWKGDNLLGFALMEVRDALKI